MADAVVIIGGNEYPLKPLVFSQMKKVWPFLKKHMNRATPETEGLTPEQLGEVLMSQELEAADDAIEIISIAMNDPEKTPKWIADNLLASELNNLQPAMLTLLQISGLVPEGNGLKELDEMAAQFLKTSPSTETSTS